MWGFTEIPCTKQQMLEILAMVIEAHVDLLVLQNGLNLKFTVTIEVLDYWKY